MIRRKLQQGLEQMLRRRQINTVPSRRSPRHLAAAAAARIRGAARPLEERALWPASDALRDLAEVARWPFERVVWPVQRRAVWPLRERLAGRRPARGVAGAGALGAVAVAAVAVGLLISGGSGQPEAGPVARPARVAMAPAAKPAVEKPRGPTLQGVPPSFGADKGTATAKQGGASPSAKDEAAAGSTAPEGGAEAAASAGTNGSAGGEAAAATSSKAKPVPAGPAAMKVARRFSEAFVFYEIGEHPIRAKAVFGETATQQLSEALAERPPRLPANAKVPKAKVVNLVPGPRLGRAYTVSVSLLRVGLTSELRISLQHSRAEGWRVSEILG
jgi:hypothetical protein